MRRRRWKYFSSFSPGWRRGRFSHFFGERSATSARETYDADAARAAHPQPQLRRLRRDGLLLRPHHALSLLPRLEARRRMPQVQARVDARDAIRMAPAVYFATRCKPRGHARDDETRTTCVRSAGAGFGCWCLLFSHRLPARGLASRSDGWRGRWRPCRDPRSEDG